MMKTYSVHPETQAQLEEMARAERTTVAQVLREAVALRAGKPVPQVRPGPGNGRSSQFARRAATFTLDDLRACALGARAELAAWYNDGTPPSAEALAAAYAEAGPELQQKLTEAFGLAEKGTP